MKKHPIYKKTYFHAVRRAMAENETFMRVFMDSVAVHYDIPALEKLDEVLVKIPDNDLFDLIMGNKTPADFAGAYDESILEDIVKGAAKR